MRQSEAIFNAISTPLYAGVAIVLLLSVRQAEEWKKRRRHHGKPDALRQDGPVRLWKPVRDGKKAFG